MGRVLKYTSIYEVFAKVLADSDLGNEQLRVSDWKTWSGEALKKIGAFPQFANRITGIEDTMYPTNVPIIANYRTELPCDLYSIIQLAVSKSKTGPWMAARTATGSFDIQKGLSRALPSNAIDTYPPSTNDKVQFVADMFNESYSNAFTRLNANQNLGDIIDAVFMNQSNPAINSLDQYDRDITYTQNGPYLDFNISSGYCLIAYKALPTDAEGYPLIPDVEEVKEALYWYIEMKTLYPQWRKGQIRDAVMEHAEQEWKSKRLGAKGELMMVTGDQQKAIMNSWVRLFPNLNADQSFFKNIGQQQVIRNR